MTISEPIIRDLLPLYLADEASTETQQLVETYLAANPTFMPKPLAFETTGLMPEIALPHMQDIEIKSLQETKRLMQQRRTFLALGLFFLGMGGSFRFDSSGIEWFWTETPQVAAILLVASACMWVGLAFVLYRLKFVEI